MSQLRVHDMAGEFGISSDEVMVLLRAMDVPVRTHFSPLTDEQVARVRARWEREKRARVEKPAPPARRRRGAAAPAEAVAPAAVSAPAEAAPVRRRTRAAAAEPPVSEEEAAPAAASAAPATSASAGVQPNSAMSRPPRRPATSLPNSLWLPRRSPRRPPRRLRRPHRPLSRRRWPVRRPQSRQPLRHRLLPVRQHRLQRMGAARRRRPRACRSTTVRDRARSFRVLRAPVP